MKSPCVLRRTLTQEHDLEIEVKTGDKRGAGTDCKLWVVVTDIKGRSSHPLRLSNRLFTNWRNQICSFKLKSRITDLEEVCHLEFWLEKFGFGEHWFVEYIKIRVVDNNSETMYPIHRWVHPVDHHFCVVPFDCSLPQLTLTNLRPQRHDEIVEKKQEYRYRQKVDSGPMMVRIQYIFDYKTWMFLKIGIYLSSTLL